jgi:hypothetical protein
MALNDLDKEAFRRGLGDEAAYEELVAIIVAGTQPNTLSDNAKIVLGNALGLDRVKASVVAAFEGGSALSDEAKTAIRRMVGNTHGVGDNLVTEIGAIA